MSVSRICLGCMSFGGYAEWTLDTEESEAIIDRAIDLGINFFDTANVYANGEWMGSRCRRHQCLHLAKK